MNDYISTPTVGEIIVEEFMKPLNMSVDTLAEGIGLSENRIIELLDGDIQITTELSKRLSALKGYVPALLRPRSHVLLHRHVRTR